MAPETSVGANNTGMILGFFFFLVDKCYQEFIRSIREAFLNYFFL